MANWSDPLEEFIGGVRFRFWQPDSRLPRGFGFVREVLRRLGLHVDALNTVLPRNCPDVGLRMRQLMGVRRMSTVAIGAIVHRAVALMPDSEAYLNVGVWHGFTLFAGMVGNPTKTCIGVDNFSQFGGPRRAFQDRFARYRSSAHRFYEMDYMEYLSHVHRGPVGVYYFDGPHTYEHQVNNLRRAEEFFVPGSVVFVDDTNAEVVRRATLEFMAHSRRRYRIVLDQRTSRNCHPTYWNGLMILRHEG